MFGLFKRKEKLVMWNEEVKMTEFIILMMSEYLKRCQGDIVLVKEEPGLRIELDRLKKLGLGSSENAKLLITKITEIENCKEKSKFGKEVVEFIKTMSNEFPKSYLISFDQFFRIIQKYKLYCRPIEEYQGIIPPENIEELELVKNKLIEWMSNNNLKLPINYISDYFHFWYISCIHYSSSRGGSKETAEYLMDLFEKHGSIGGLEDYSSYTRKKSFDLNDPKFCNVKFNSWINNYTKDIKRGGYTLDSYKLTGKDLLIAAPKNCFSEDYKVKELPVDPIVYQCCPYGIIVHSVWGEEADDKVLEKYKELNKSILR